MVIVDQQLSANNIFVYNGGRPHLSQGYGMIEVTINPDIEVIENEAFQNWRSLVKIIIPNTVKRIGDNAFQGCTALSTVQFSDSLEQIGSEAFWSCLNLTYINLQNSSITQIGPRAFAKCSKLSSISLPSINTISTSCFKSCYSLSKVIIPPSVTLIDESAFEDCKQLASINLSLSTIQAINSCAFYGCKSLQSIQLASTSLLGDDAFENCRSLKIIYFGRISFHEEESSSEEFLDAKFADCHATPLFLTNKSGQEYFGERGPTVTLHHMQQVINEIPNNLPSDDQVHTVHQILRQRYPRIFGRIERLRFNLLHLLVYMYPTEDENVYPVLSELLVKCPQTTVFPDTDGRTPLHHAVASTRNNMDPRSYNLLLNSSPDEVLHLAIRSKLASWYDIEEIMKTKINALRVEEKDSGLFPFMIASECSFDLTIIYQLLSMQPDILKQYDGCLRIDCGEMKRRRIK